MNTLRLLATGAVLALATPAFADCAADLAALEGGAHNGGISKDGSLAPLEGAAGGDTGTTGAAAPGDMAAPAGATTGSTEGIAKDGSHTPLEGQAGGSQAGVARHGDDAQAQQDGKPTAAEAAMGGDDKRAAAIQRAHEALAAKDEDACRKALDEAKAL